MADRTRLIEVAFPLKQASLDSVHEKNVRHGHISTLHIWPARRPLAACRAALIATLLPDPGNDTERKKLLERIGGTLRKKAKKEKGKPDKLAEVTDGGILHWGRESSPDLDWFREEIRKAYGGRAPKVMDPFSGGGAIPLEAMRLGCEATAVDINPVAWFILKCTLEYPQKLAGQTWPLPEWAQQASTKGKAKKVGRKQKANATPGLFDEGGATQADLAAHVRAWGNWVLEQVRPQLDRFYPSVDGKPTVAYLWARTVTCKNRKCLATIPLLKTRWLCKKKDGSKRVVLKMEQDTDEKRMRFQVEESVPAAKGSAAQKREHDKKLGGGTMSRSGVTCPFCSGIVTMVDLQDAGSEKGLGTQLISVVFDTPGGKRYRDPTPEEALFNDEVRGLIQGLFNSLPFGLPTEDTPRPFGARNHGAALRRYGMKTWVDVFTPRQLYSLGVFLKAVRAARDALRTEKYPDLWVEAITTSLAAMLDRLANQGSTSARWNLSGENVEGTFARFAFPMVWDFAEVNPLAETSGGFRSAIEWVSMAVEHFSLATKPSPKVSVIRQSAIQDVPEQVDLVVTDPPYYDAISYADLMDFFYVWLRRSLNGLNPAIDAAFATPLSPKWNHDENDGELIDNPTRFSGDKAKSKQVYEDGMFRAFQSSYRALSPEGRLVIVFAHKHPDAWEALVSATIRAGFVVDGSWPIQTERGTRTRSLSSSALSSSVWLVCKKRPVAARPGWDNKVLEDMRANIHQRLRAYWDAGIRGPDFVWAATGPALEAYSRHPVVKKANAAGETMSVAEFLRAVRRMVVDFVVGRVIMHGGESTASGLDDLTTYYLLHRHDFGLEDAPIGACILYAVSCGLSDAALADRLDLLARTGKGGKGAEDDDDADDGDGEDDSDSAGSGSEVKLKTWSQRKRKTMGYDSEGKPAPLIDQVHRMLHLWKAGDVGKVDEYLNDRGLRRNTLFHQLLQALIELAPAGGEERALLESISNHVAARGADKATTPSLFGDDMFTESEAATDAS